MNKEKIKLVPINNFNKEPLYWLIGSIVGIILIIIGFILVYPTTSNYEIECNSGDLGIYFRGDWEDKQVKYYEIVSMACEMDKDGNTKCPESEDNPSYKNIKEFTPKSFEINGIKNINCKIKVQGTTNLINDYIQEQKFNRDINNLKEVLNEIN